MVTSTPSETLPLLLYEPQNKNFDFGTLKTLILHARSIFFKGGHPTKIWRKNLFHENPVEVRSFDGTTWNLVPENKALNNLNTIQASGLRIQSPMFLRSV